MLLKVPPHKPARQNSSFLVISRRFSSFLVISLRDEPAREMPSRPVVKIFHFNNSMYLGHKNDISSILYECIQWSLGNNNYLLEFNFKIHENLIKTIQIDLPTFFCDTIVYFKQPLFRLASLLPLILDWPALFVFVCHLYLSSNHFLVLPLYINWAITFILDNLDFYVLSNTCVFFRTSLHPAISVFTKN